MIGMSFIRVVGLALAAYFILLHHSFVTLGFQCEKNILSFMACVKNLCAPEFSGVLARLIKVKSSDFLPIHEQHSLLKEGLLKNIFTLC